MNKDYYLEYYHLEREHWWFKVREQIILEHLTSVITARNIKVLNIGIATGRTSEVLQKFGEVTSIEYDETCCEFVRDKVGIPVLNGSVLDIEFADNSFDLVCAFDVIEHVEDDIKAIAEMKRVCKKNGIICITVPAFMTLWSQHDVVNKHFRRYIMKEIIRLFDNNENGKIIYKTYFNSILFFPILSFRLISRLLPTGLFRKGAGSDFSVIKNESPVNTVLYNIFNFEKIILRKVKSPIGISIMASWQKLE